jgi:hypothetical protein
LIGIIDVFQEEMDDDLEDDEEYYSDELLQEEIGDYVFVDDEDDPQ